MDVIENLLAFAKNTAGWYPLFGVTHCSIEELEGLNKIGVEIEVSCGTIH